MNCVRPLILVVLLSCAVPVLAVPPTASASADTQAMPAWEQLPPAQRDLLMAPVRERWNGNPGERARMLEHAQRWQKMTPGQHQGARRGMKRWSQMKPEQREQARALFKTMRALPPEQRKALRTQLQAMTPQQRRAWLQQHAAGDRPQR